jgi:hypothetical protein
LHEGFERLSELFFVFLKKSECGKPDNFQKKLQCSENFSLKMGMPKKEKTSDY